MPRTANDLERAKRSRLARLDEDERAAIVGARVRCVFHLFVLWFFLFVGWHFWPYIFNADMWPVTLYSLWMIGHGAAYVAAVIGFFAFIAGVVTGGRAFNVNDDFYE